MSYEEGPNPSGMCFCGCGNRTNRATCTNTPRGVRVGQFSRYCPNHSVDNKPEAVQKRVESRIERGVEAGFDTPCWAWRGYVGVNGYGQIGIRGKRYLAHRVVWQREHGSIPEGLELDHLCRNTICVNPNHLEPVTHRENSSRAMLKITPEFMARVVEMKATGKYSIRAIGRTLGVSHHTVRRALSWAADA